MKFPGGRVKVVGILGGRGMPKFERKTCEFLEGSMQKKKKKRKIERGKGKNK